MKVQLLYDTSCERHLPHCRGRKETTGWVLDVRFQNWTHFGSYLQSSWNFNHWLNWSHWRARVQQCKFMVRSEVKKNQDGKKSLDRSFILGARSPFVLLPSLLFPSSPKLQTLSRLAISTHMNSSEDYSVGRKDGRVECLKFLRTQDEALFRKLKEWLGEKEQDHEQLPTVDLLSKPESESTEPRNKGKKRARSSSSLLQS